MIAAYFVVVMAIGFWSSRKVKTEEDFFLGGRRFGKGLLIMHWLCTGTHSEMAVQVAGATARVGLGGIWYQWMWLFSTPFYWLMAPVTRRLRVTTTGDFFRIRYGRSLEMLYALVGLFYFGLSIALLLRGAGAAISGATGGAVPTEASVIALAVLFSTYVMAGGLVAAVYTDLLQGLMIIVLSVLLVPAGSGRGRRSGGPARQAWSGDVLDHGPARRQRRRPLVRRHDVGIGPGGLRRPAPRHDRDRLGQDRDRGAGRHGLRQLHQEAADDRLGLHRTDRPGRVSRGARRARPERPAGTPRQRDAVWPGHPALPGRRLARADDRLPDRRRHQRRDLHGRRLGSLHPEFLRPRGPGPIRHPLPLGRPAGRRAACWLLGILLAVRAESVTQLVLGSVKLIGLLGAAFWLGVIWRRATAAGVWASFLGSLLVWAVMSAEPPSTRSRSVGPAARAVWSAPPARWACAG